MQSGTRVNFKSLASTTLPSSESSDLRVLVTTLVQQELGRLPAPTSDLRPRLDAVEMQLRLLSQTSAEAHKETSRAALLTATRTTEDLNQTLRLIEDLANSSQTDDLHAVVDRKFSEISASFRELAAVQNRSQEEISRLSQLLDAREAEMRASVDRLTVEWESRLSRIETSVSESLTALRMKQETAFDKFNEAIKMNSSSLYRLQSEFGGKIELVRSEIKASEGKVADTVNFKLNEVKQSEIRVKQSLQDAVKLMHNNAQQSEFELRSILKTSEQFLSDNAKNEARKNSDACLKLEQSFMHSMQQLEIKFANAMHGNFEETDKRVTTLKADISRQFKEFSDNLDDTKIQLITDVKDVKMKTTEISLEQAIIKEHGERRIREVTSIQEAKNAVIAENITKVATKASLDCANLQDLLLAVTRKEISDQHTLTRKHCDEIMAKIKLEISDQLRGTVETLAERIALVDVDLRDSKDRLDGRIDQCSEQGRLLGQEISALEDAGRDLQERLLKSIDSTDARSNALEDVNAFVTQIND